jgi:hypothetical protein
VRSARFAPPYCSSVKFELGSEADRSERERERVDRELPAHERARIVEALSFLLGAHVENGEAAVRTADEVVVRDRDSATTVGDVLVEQEIGPPGRRARRRDGVDEVAAVLHRIAHVPEATGRSRAAHRAGGRSVLRPLDLGLDESLP